MGDVAQAFIDKLRSRAPYLFDGTVFVVDMETQDRLWQEGKRAELAYAALSQAEMNTRKGD